MYYVYILKCSDARFYVGCTDNLKERLARHSKGHISATKRRLPVELEEYFVFKHQHIAFKLEKYLKSGSGRAFMRRHLLRAGGAKRI